MSFATIFEGYLFDLDAVDGVDDVDDVVDVDAVEYELVESEDLDVG